MCSHWQSVRSGSMSIQDGISYGNGGLPKGFAALGCVPLTSKPVCV